MNTPAEDFPGRSHFDYVVDWIANKLDTDVIPFHIVRGTGVIRHLRLQDMESRLSVTVMIQQNGNVQELPV